MTMNSRQSTSVPLFQLLETSIALGSSDVLGLWKTTEMPPAPLSFTSNNPPTISPQIWRANLPPDVRQANLHLNAAGAKLVLVRQTIESVPERLAHFSAKWQSVQSFDLGASLPQQPEADLKDFLQEIESGTNSHSFSIEDSLIGPDVRLALHRFLDLLNHLRNTLEKYAWVETFLGTRVIARTAVGWSGDVDTAWLPELTLSETAIHKRTLLLALKTRDALARTIIIVAQAAVKISLLLSTPVTAPLALLAAYKYVRALIEQFQFLPLKDIQEV